MIDRKRVIRELESLRDICNAKSNMAIGNGKIAWAGYANAADDALTLLKEQPEIVRCKDCIYHHYTNDSAHIPYCELIDYGYGWKDDDFCSRGERK